MREKQVGSRIHQQQKVNLTMNILYSSKYSFVQYCITKACLQSHAQKSRTYKVYLETKNNKVAYHFAVT